MPTLNSQLLTEVQDYQPATIELEAKWAMESLIEPMMQVNKFMYLYFEPIRQLQRTVETMIEPMRRIHEEISNLPMIQIMATAQKIAESQQKIIEALTVSLIFNFSKLVSFGALPAEIIEGEIQEKSPKNTMQMDKTQTIALTHQQALVPVIPASPRYETKSIMGLKEITGRSFQFKRKTLKKLSYRNCEGKLLSLFLASKDLFVSDTDIYDALHIPDGRSFSWVLRNLKRKFRENGLSVVIERRWNPDGYIFIDISQLH